MMINYTCICAKICMYVYTEWAKVLNICYIRLIVLVTFFKAYKSNKVHFSTMPQNYIGLRLVMRHFSGPTMVMPCATERYVFKQLQHICTNMVSL